MAESLVQVTEGSGKKLHTFQRSIGGQNVEDEVVIVGEQYLPTYVLSFDPTSTATAASHIIQIMAGASLNLYIRRITLYQIGLATTAAFDRYELRRLTTAGTGGTSFTPVALDSTDPAPGATGMTLPTVKGTESGPVGRHGAYFMQTAAASNVPPTPLLDIVFDLPRMKALRIAAGTSNGLAVKQVAGVAGATVIGDIWFAEANF